LIGLDSKGLDSFTPDGHQQSSIDLVSIPYVLRRILCDVNDVDVAQNVSDSFDIATSTLNVSNDVDCPRNVSDLER
jgi:hypothetical protein